MNIRFFRGLLEFEDTSDTKSGNMNRMVDFLFDFV
jgi:hypothetical protein